MFTVQRYPVTISFRLSEADAARLDRLLKRYGSTFGTRGDSARFRLMLKNIDLKLLSPWDPEEEHDAYQENEQASQAEELRFSQWKKKQSAQRRAAAQMPKHPLALNEPKGKAGPSEKPWDPNDPSDDRNWFTEEDQDPDSRPGKEEEDPGSED